MNFFKTSILSGINTAVTVATGLVTNKLVAVFIGPEGLGVIGQFKDFMKLLLSVSQLGLDSGIVKNVSESQHDKVALAKVLSTAFKAQLLVSVVLALGIFLFRNQILIYLLGTREHAEIFVLLGLAVFPMFLFSSLLAILNGLHQIKRYVSISIIANVLSSGCTIVLIFLYGLSGVLYSLVLAQFITFGTLLFFLKNSGIKISWFTQKFDLGKFRELLKFSAMFISGTLTLSLSLIFVRKYLASNLGLEFAGYWEAMWRISALYLTFLTSAFAFYLLPTFSKLKTKYLRKEIFKIWKITLPVALLIGTTVFLAKDILIPILYSEEFLVIGSLFLFQIMGDILRINSWVLGNLLVAKVHAKVFIAVQIGWGVLFCILVTVLVPQYGFKGVSIAYFLTYVAHFGFMNIYFKKLLWKI